VPVTKAAQRQIKHKNGTNTQNEQNKNITEKKNMKEVLMQIHYTMKKHRQVDLKILQTSTKSV
jgi:hypothetical protein